MNIINKRLNHEFRKYKISLRGEYQNKNRRLHDGISSSGMGERTRSWNSDKNGNNESRKSDGLSQHADGEGISGGRSMGNSKLGDSLSDVIDDKPRKYSEHTKTKKFKR